MKKDYAYGVIVFYMENETPHYLILKQVQGHWSFPKGHAEKDETPIETALRELTEETGIDEVNLISGDIQVKDEYVIKPDSPKPVHKFVEFFIGWVPGKDVVVQDGEIFDYKWITSSEGGDILTYDSSKRLLEAADSIVQKYLQMNYI